jgi:transcriptional regulator with XRE-family HTH domain
MEKKTIGLKLKQLRNNNSMSVEDVLKILFERFSIEIRPNTLYGYEVGRTSPDVDVFLSLCIIYNCKDILYEFGYTTVRECWKLDNDDADILDKYHSLSEDGKNMIRGALGLEKSKARRQSTVSKNTEEYAKDA